MRWLISVFLLISLGLITPIWARNRCKEVLRTTYLDDPFIAEMQRLSRRASPATKRFRDIVQTAGFSTASLNRAILKNHNLNYTLTLPRGFITDQHRSGRCWIFAVTNMLRSIMLREGLVDIHFEFSENYIWFFHFYEQSNRFIEKVIARRGREFSQKKFRELLQFGPEEGGYFEYFAYLVHKYGLVPKDRMGETFQSVYPTDLIIELERAMTHIAAEMNEKIFQKKNPNPDTLRRQKKEWMRRLWIVLETHLGTPPEKFEYRVQEIKDSDRDSKIGEVNREKAELLTFTPTEFAWQFARFNPASYVTVTANPLLKSNKLYRVRDSQLGKPVPRETRFPRDFINVSPGVLEKLVLKSLQGETPVWAAVDISQDIDHDTGIMHPKLYDRAPLYGRNSGLDKPLSLKTGIFHRFFQPRHAILINGVDWPDGTPHPIKFRVENSWGYEAGDNGTYHMYREWFQKYNHEIVVPSTVLNKELLNLLKGDPQILDPSEDF